MSATAGAARFVCQPSDHMAFAFKTTRAQPRPAHAQPEMETLLNVPEDELEELLAVALSRVDNFLWQDSDANKEQSWILTRVEAECSARSRDIEAVSALVAMETGAGLEALCRAIGNVPGRTLRATKQGAEKRSWVVEAALEMGGTTWGPIDCTQACGIATEAEDAASRVTQAAKITMEAGVGEKGSDVKVVVGGPVEVVDKGRTFNVKLAWLWSESHPSVMLLLPVPGVAADGRPEDASAVPFPTRAAQELVRGLRRTGALAQLCAGALVPPCPGGVAAQLAGRDQDWDPAGRFPAVSLNIIQSNLSPKGTYVASLTLREGMRWDMGRAQAPRGGSMQPEHLVARIADSKAFCRLLPPRVPWAYFTGKIGALVEGLRANGADPLLGREDFTDGIQYCMDLLGVGTPDALGLVDTWIDSLLEETGGPPRGMSDRAARGASGPSAGTAPASQGDNGRRFECVPSPKAELAFETVRAQPRHRDAQPKMETFLNARAADVEAMLTTALRRVFKIMGPPVPIASVLRGDREGGTGYVLTQIQSECFASSRDLKATSTLVMYDAVRDLEAFCRAISVEGRTLCPAPGHSTFANVHATLTYSGRKHGPLDCTKLMQAYGTAASFKARQGYQAVIGLGMGPTHTVFREVVSEENGRGGKEDVEVLGVFDERHPNKIIVGRAADFPGFVVMPLLRNDDRNSPYWIDVLAGVVVRALRRPGALRAVCAGALLPPLSRAAACAEAADQAWDFDAHGPAGVGPAGFPAVSINILMGGTQMLWLELPDGMRWRAGSRDPSTGLTKMAVEVVSLDKVGDEYDQTFGTTWKAVTDALARLDRPVPGYEQLDSLWVGSPEHREATQSVLDGLCTSNALSAIPHDRRRYPGAIPGPRIPRAGP
ncbi:unnamed protein product [Pedinophyceae sp. YPF-701]|nr:unnamed protein product [Pedinophyceae sp. YPF-701]